VIENRWNEAGIDKWLEAQRVKLEQRKKQIVFELLKTVSAISSLKLASKSTSRGGISRSAAVGRLATVIGLKELWAGGRACNEAKRAYFLTSDRRLLLVVCIRCSSFVVALTISQVVLLLKQGHLLLQVIDLLAE
jgi:hypothetical protein